MKKHKIIPLTLIASLSLSMSACGGGAPAVKKEENSTQKQMVSSSEAQPEAAEIKVAAAPQPVAEPEAKAEPAPTPEKAPEPAVEQPKAAAKAEQPAPAAAPATPSAKTTQKAALSAASKKLASEKELKQKISYSRMMFMSKASKRIAASANDQAKAMLAESKEKMEGAKKALEAGDRRTAQDLIDESMRVFNAASIMVPSESVIAEQKKRYEDLLKELDDNKATHKDNYERMVKKDGKEAGVDYDHGEVDRLTGEAKKQATGKNYISAIKNVEDAKRLVTNAISQMLDSQTITYEINIDTPEGEWAYELDRYLGYEELVPVAIEAKKPNKGQLMLINRKVDKGKWRAEEARKAATSGDYPKAIAMILDATKDIRSALRIMGVKQ